MMEKTRTLFNVVVLFVLVLFGSVVPASAQDLQGYGGVIQTVVAAVGAAVGALFTLLTFWRAFDRKVDNLGTKIDTTTRDTNNKIDAAKKELKDDAQAAHAAIGTNIRESEKRLDANINKVHATVQLLLEQAIRGQSSGSAQDRP